MLESDILIENVFRIAASSPERVFTKLYRSGSKPIDINYALLLHQGSLYAERYRSAGVERNEVVVIIHNDVEQTIYALVGALIYGAVPTIFAHPSAKISPSDYSKTLVHLLGVCDTRFVVTYSALSDELADYVDREKVQLLLSTSASSCSDRPERPEYDADQVVLLQHSSGTTGLKKGVALSNRSVINQLRNYAAAIDLTDADKIVSWLPLYHDMGLIACFIMPLVSGVPLVLMSPFEWIANPAMLLKAIHNERGTLCWMPNFAYNFLASRITETDLVDIDLSSMRAFINCAEPISANSHELFYQRFKSYGLRQEILGSCYAMAENTFAVTQSKIADPVRFENLDANVLRTHNEAVLANPETTSCQTVVSSGRLIPNNEVLIIDAIGSELSDRRVGEIIIKSDSMLSEYYHRPDLTALAIKNGWYHSGDFGYLADGHLFVLGRLKDLIIVAGKNIYPQDIEEIVGGISGVYPGRVVAFGLYDENIGTENVVILAETAEDKPKHLAIKLAIAKAVREQLECIANEIILLPHMWLQKSSSGKISRPGNREKYLTELRSL